MRGKKFLQKNRALLSGVAAAVLVFLIPFLSQAQTQIATNFIGGAALDLGYTLMNAVLVVIQSAFGLLVFIGATVLNLSIKIMLNFNTIVDSIPAINETWRILRDVGFMFFIFIILYHSILYILGFGTEALKILVNIILVGILINFSMFFTKVMIDASNVVALQFYKSIQIQDNVIPTDSLLGSFSNNVTEFKTSLDGGVGFAVMQALRLPSLYDPSGIEKGGAGISGVRVIVALVMSCIVMFITAGVLLAAGFMFIVRIGILLILLVFSPIPFLAMVIDKLNGEAKKWWGALIDQLVFPPVFLCILYITLRIASSPGYKQLILANNPTFSNVWFAGSAEALFGGIMVILNYAIIIIFLGIAMKSANQFGGDAAKIGLQYADKVKSWGNSVRSVAARNTVGRLARKTGEVYDQKAAEWEKRGGSRASLVKIFRATGADEAVKSGITSVQKSKFGGTRNLEEQEKYAKGRSREFVDVRRETTQKAGIAAGIADPKGVSGTPADPTNPAKGMLSNAQNLKSILKNISNKELEKIDKDTLKNPAFAGYLSSSQVDHIVKSDNFDDDFKQNLKGARLNGLLERIKDNDELDEIVNQKPNEVAKLPPKLLTNIYVSSLLTQDILKKLVDEGLSQSDKDAIRDNIERTHKAFLASPTSIKAKYHDRLKKAFAWLQSPDGAVF